MQLREELDEYAKALYEENEAGFTLREQLGRYESLKDATDCDIPIAADYVHSLAGRASLEEDIRTISRLAILTEEIGNPAQHPLSRVLGSTYDPAAFMTLGTQAKQVLDAVEGLNVQRKKVGSWLPTWSLRSRSDWEKAADGLSAATADNQLPAEWAAHPALSELIADLEFLLGEKETLDEITERSEGWTTAFFSLDAEELERDWAEAKNSGLFKRKKAMGDFVLRLSTYSKRTFSEEGIPQAIAALREYASKTESLKRYVGNAESYLARFKTINGYDWAKLKRAVESARAVVSEWSLEDADVRALAARLQNDDAEKANARETAHSIRKVLVSAAELEALVGGLRAEAGEDWLEALAQTAQTLADHPRMLQQWMHWRSLAQDVQDRGLPGVIDALMEGASPEQLPVAFERSVYRVMCALSLSRHERIATFSGRLFEEMVQQYSQASEKLFDLAKMELQLHLAKRVPNLTLAARGDEEAVILSRAIKSKGRGVSIRMLFSSIPRLLKGLAPCMLMSPLSVAQYLDFSNEPFDLVVFDEASQLETCKAVGALARARNAIVVGDPKQMPPTSFFTSAIDDDELGALNDMESILDDCLAISMPETYLQWHYRSQHESLISFSNAQFYEGKMCTFPSVDDSVSRITWEHVPGHYEGSGMNSFEAKAVVEELRHRFKQSSGTPSIGVITFNVKQQALIEDLLEAAFVDDPAFEEWTMSGTEPLFVKNLENVQGDERDSILFSVAYAPDENGKLMMRFGPVNNEGGWRRLNVAVTRARKEMKVFSTLCPEQIDPARTTSKGVRSLKAFLEFAKQGRMMGSNRAALGEDHIAGAVCRELEKRGYRLKRNVGSSAYRVDIAIEGRDGEGYRAGILFDGASYGRARSTRDREVARDKILRALGWNLYHVWALDWWTDSTKVINDIVDFVGEPVGVPEPAQSGLRSEGGADEESEQRNDPSETMVQKAGNDSLLQQYASAVDSELRSDEETAPTKGSEKLHEPGALEERPVSIESADREEDGGGVRDQRGEMASEGESDRRTSIAHIAKSDYVFAELPDGPFVSPDEYITDYGDEIARRIAVLVEAEAPIEKTRLLNRVRESFGIARSGKHILARNEALLKTVPHRETKRGEMVFVWRKDQEPKEFDAVRVCDADDSRKPSIVEICDEELINMLEVVLAECGPLSKDELIRRSAEQFGFKRVASRLYDTVATAITKAKRRKRIADDRGRLTIAQIEE